MIKIPGATIIDDEMPDRARFFSSYAQFQCYDRPDRPVIEMATRSLAEQIGSAIARERKFFDINIDHHGYGTAKINAVVMTIEEYAAALNKSFQRGLAHGAGAPPRYDLA